MSSRGAESGMKLMVPCLPLWILPLTAPSASGMFLTGIPRGPPKPQHDIHRMLFSSLFPLLLTGFAALVR